MWRCSHGLALDLISKHEGPWAFMDHFEISSPRMRPLWPRRIDGVWQNWTIMLQTLKPLTSWRWFTKDLQQSINVISTIRSFLVYVYAYDTVWTVYMNREYIVVFFLRIIVVYMVLWIIWLGVWTAPVSVCLFSLVS